MAGLDWVAVGVWAEFDRWLRSPSLHGFGTIFVYSRYFLNKPNDGSLSLSDEMNVDFAEMVRI